MTASEPAPPDATPTNDEGQESGLWLWRGEAPPHAEAAATSGPSRAKRIARFLGLATRRAAWLLPPVGLMVTGLSAFAMVHFLTSGTPMPRDSMAALLQPAPAPSVAPAANSAANPTPPAVLPVSQVEQPPAAAAEPPALVAEPPIAPAESKAVKSRSARKSRHARRVYRPYQWAWETCRYHCDWGVPMSWHGGGY